MTTPAERLEQIRMRLAAASVDYALDYAGRGEAISAVLFPGAEPVIIAQLTADCPYGDRDLMVHARADIAFLSELVRRHGEARVKDRRSRERLEREIARLKGKPAANYAAECAIKCADPAFVRWLQSAHALPMDATKTAIETRIRSLLAIASRKDLNTDPQAANRWRKMVRDFEAWRRG